LQGVSMIKTGIPPIVTSDQNPVIFASTYIKAGTQAMQSLQQGADPATVLSFLQLCGPAAMAQLQRFANDPLRKEIFDILFAAWGKLAELTDQIKGMLDQQAAQAQQSQEKAQGVMSDSQIKALKTSGDLKLKAQKQSATLSMQEQKHKQALALQDATVASQINRQNALAQAEAKRKQMESEAVSTTGE
jgi:hypothetical protein